MKLRKLRSIDPRNFILAPLTIGIVALALFLFPNNLGRILESGRDFGICTAYYFVEMFNIDADINVSINATSDFLPSISFPASFTAFELDWNSYWNLIGNKVNFAGYLMFLMQLAKILMVVAMILLPLYLVGSMLFSMYLKKVNNDYNVDSRSVRFARRFGEKVYTPLKLRLRSLYAFFVDTRVYRYIWICALCYAANVLPIVLSFLGYYLYFACSFDFDNIFLQIYKLLADVSPLFSTVPLWIWGIVALRLIAIFRRKVGYARLNHFERRNRGFINERPLVTMACGSMRKGKTTLITDMALSKQIMLRDKAYEKILENDLKFPYFPWINFERTLKASMARHEIYNLATVRCFVDKLHHFWRLSIERPEAAKYIARHLKKRYGIAYKNLLFDYDSEKYGLEYRDALRIVDLWEVLRNYAQLYFIYVIQCSLLVSNYSIRVDDLLDDLGNFPLWRSDFFKRNEDLSAAYTRHAHILDFDALRLGRLLLQDNAYASSFEFGVVTVTEIGKERGNNLENQELKKKTDETNQKNDKFNDWLKMCGHAATVDNFTFLFVLTDEQRASSWGADARELCDIVHIVEKSDVSLAMPFFTFEDMFLDWFQSKFEDFYQKYRYVRSDNTLLQYVFKSVWAKLYSYRTRIYNTFGYRTVKVEVERGTQDGAKVEKKYYLMDKKIYSNRFTTDCFSDFFHAKSIRSTVGLPDIPEFKSERATYSEMMQQNSYFFNGLSSLLGKFDDKDS